MLDLPKHALKILVVGGGGREHALCWKLAQSPHIQEIFCAPGNGGTASEQKTKNLEIATSDFEALTNFSKTNQIDLVVIGPDNPLAEGIVDFMQDRRLRVFGPRKNAAKLEWSKSYAKEFMFKHGIPTPRTLICQSLAEATAQLKANTWARVLKVDGLALGKGVYVCNSEEEMLGALDEVFADRKFGTAGDTVLLEEKYMGQELSLLLFCDGKRFVPLESSQDFKRRKENDLGPNTGGMGALSPAPHYIDNAQAILETILRPLTDTLRLGDLDYQGILYVGVLIGSSQTNPGKESPVVLEFNARFGDPETQVLLPRLKSDLLPILWACTEGKLDQVEINWNKEMSSCIVAVTNNYPQTGSSNDPITLPPIPKDISLFHSGTKISDNQLVTAGGRIFSVTALGKDLSSAAERNYQYLKDASFKDMDYRKDIASLERTKCH